MRSEPLNKVRYDVCPPLPLLKNVPQIVIDALPAEWDGYVIFVEHNAGLVRHVRESE